MMFLGQFGQKLWRILAYGSRCWLLERWPTAVPVILSIMAVIKENNCCPKEHKPDNKSLSKPRKCCGVKNLFHLSFKYEVLSNSRRNSVRLESRML